MQSHLLNEIHEQISQKDYGPWVVQIQKYNGYRGTTRTSEFAVIKMKKLSMREPRCFTVEFDGERDVHYTLILLNIRGYKEIKNDFLEKKKQLIYGVFDGLFHYLPQHEAPSYQGGYFEQRNYRYYLSCKLFALAEDSTQSYKVSLKRTAIKNMLLCFNR